MLGGLKVDDLKDLCARIGLQKSGRKSELFLKLRGHFDQLARVKGGQEALDTLSNLINTTALYRRALQLINHAEHFDWSNAAGLREAIKAAAACGMPMQRIEHLKNVRHATPQPFSTLAPPPPTHSMHQRPRIARDRVPLICQLTGTAIASARSARTS